MRDSSSADWVVSVAMREQLTECIVEKDHIFSWLVGCKVLCSRFGRYTSEKYENE